jgi:hypothetical protein
LTTSICVMTRNTTLAHLLLTLTAIQVVALVVVVVAVVAVVAASSLSENTSRNAYTLTF